MKNERYSMSFTTGSLFHKESVLFAVLFDQLRDWRAVRAHVLANNVLQARTLNTAKRVCREIISRLKMLTRTELETLINSHPHDQAYLLWIAMCRRYKFIGDFAVEVLRERYLSLKCDLQAEDFDVFFNDKSDWHSELEKLKPATKSKLRQLLFKILREADLLGANNIIHAAHLSPQLVETITAGANESLVYFPAFESELIRVVK